MSDKKKIEPARARVWAFIAYPESAPADWVSQLRDLHVEILISPLHDKDINPDGEAKKEHYHVIVKFDAPKTRQQAQAVSDLVCGVAVEYVSSTRGYARYLCHLDNPEKAAYSVSEVVSLGGVDYLELIAAAGDDDALLREMMRYCRENSVFSFAALADYAADTRPDWFRILSTKKTLYISQYLKSAYWEEKERMQTGSNHSEQELTHFNEQVEILPSSSDAS